MKIMGIVQLSVILLAVALSFLAFSVTVFAPAVTKTYDAATKTYTFKIMNSPIVNLSLVNNYCTGPTECFAILQLKPFISLNISTQDDINNISIEKLAGNSAFGNFTYQIQVGINITKSYNNITCTVTTFIANATNFTNTTCTNNPYETAAEEQVYVPFNFFNFNYIKDSIYTIKMRGNFKASLGYNTYEWFLGLYGFKLADWAVWSTNWTTSFADNVSQNVTGTLDRFPYVINGTSIWFNAINASTTGGIQADCDDLRSIDPTAGFSRNISIENCNTTQIVAWTNANLNSSTANASVNNSLYGGNLTVTEERSKCGVWDLNYTAVWHMGNRTDDTCYGNNLTDTAGVINSNTTCIFGNCSNFETGDNSYWAISDNPTISFVGNFTIEAWGEVSSWGSGQTLVGKWTGTEASNEWLITSSNTASISCFVNPAGAPSDIEARADGANITFNEFHHYMCTYNGDAVKFYVDGRLMNSTATTGDITSTGTGVFIGEYNSPSVTSWRGNIDEVRLSNINRSSEYAFQSWRSGQARMSKLNPPLPADTTPMSQAIQSPANSTYAGVNITINFTISESGGTCFYAVNDGANTTLTGCRNMTFLAENATNSFRLYTNDSSGNLNNSQVNFTFAGIVFRNVTRSPIFASNRSLVSINVTAVPVAPNNPVDRVLAEFNSTNYTMTLREGNTYNVTVNTTTLAESNFTIKFFANVTGNNTYQLNTSVNSWFVFDASPPKNLIFKRFTGDSFFLNESYFNFTFNATELQINNLTVLIITPDDNTVNQTLEATANTSIEINWTTAYRIGNFTVNLTFRDAAGNTNTTQAYIAFGKANVTLASRLVSRNFTSHDNAWGQGGTILQNNSQVGYILYLNINVTTDGFLEAKTPQINFRINDTFDNWTTLTIQNATGQAYTLTFYSNFVNFTSDPLSDATSYIAQANVTSNMTLNFSYQRRSGGICISDASVCNSVYRYMVYNNFSRSFNAYVRFQLPTDHTFSKSFYHPRYFVCTAGATREFGCTTFTTGVDVTSSSNGANSVGGYPVNLKEVTGTSTANDLIIQTNQSIFLIEMGIPAGAFTQASGGDSGGGGGGGGTNIVTITPIPSLEGPFCPEGYTLIKGLVSTDDKCELIGPAPAETFLSYMVTPRFGNFAPIHLVVLLIITLGLRQIHAFKKKAKA